MGEDCRGPSRRDVQAMTKATGTHTVDTPRYLLPPHIHYGSGGRAGVMAGTDGEGVGDVWLGVWVRMWLCVDGWGARTLESGPMDLRECLVYGVASMLGWTYALASIVVWSSLDVCTCEYSSIVVWTHALARVFGLCSYEYSSLDVCSYEYVGLEWS